MKTRWIVRLTILEFHPYYGMFGRLYKHEWVEFDYESSVVFYTKLQLHNFLLRVRKAEDRSEDLKKLKYRDRKYIIHRIDEVHINKEFNQDDFDHYIGSKWEEDYE